MTAVTSVVVNQIIPNANESMYVATYSKSNTGDFITVNAVVSSTLRNEPLFPIKTVKWAVATDDTAGAADPLSWSGLVISLTSGTGAGRMVLIGTC